MTAAPCSGWTTVSPFRYTEPPRDFARSGRWDAVRITRPSDPRQIETAGQRYIFGSGPQAERAPRSAGPARPRAQISLLTGGFTLGRARSRAPPSGRESLGGPECRGYG